MKHDINNSVVVPYIIAEKATENEDAQNYLIDKAERLYANNKAFRNGLDNSSDSREYLYKFMSHWLLGYNQKPS